MTIAERIETITKAAAVGSASDCDDQDQLNKEEDLIIGSPPSAGLGVFLVRVAEGRRDCEWCTKKTLVCATYSRYSSDCAQPTSW